MRIGIVGCSINGAYLAHKLAQKGHKVTVFESKKKIGGKACSGLVSERIWDFIPRNKAIIENEIRFVDVCFPKKRIEIRFRPKMLVLNRNKLDKYMASLAEKAGAKIRLGHRTVRMISLKKSRPQLVVETGGKTIVQEFDRIIGCDGANSKVRAQLGTNAPSFRLGMYTIMRKGKGQKKDRVKVIPTKYGFKWKIPQKRSMEVGAIEKAKTAKKAFRQIARTKKKKKIFSAIIPEGLVTSNNKHFALCGDAAGLTKPWSGGGIIWGMTAAQMFIDTKCSVPKYNRKLRKYFGPKFVISRVARKLVIFAGNRMPWLLPKKVVMDSDWLY